MASWTQCAYAHAPVWLQNAAISVYGLKFRHERLGGRFDDYVAEYRARELWSPAHLEEHIAAQLRRVLLNAAANVPYYQRVFRENGWTPANLARLTPEDLWRLPLTPKDHLRAAPEQFVSRSAGPMRRLHRYHTSGSAGTPITQICSSDDHRRFIAAREARSFAWAGVSVRTPRSTVGGRPLMHDQAGPPFYRRNWAERQVYFSAHHISHANLASYVEGFNTYRPQVLTGYAYAHYVLAELMLQRGVRLDYTPRALILGSEPLTPEMKATIRRAFGARAFEEYGSVENCVLATECEAGGLHVQTDFGFVEIVDDDGFPVPPGVVGRVVCTSIAASAQPLIRYDIGDLAAWSETACACGRTQFPVLRELAGRLDDIVVGRNGIAMFRLPCVFSDLPDIVESQIVQETLDRVRVRIVTTGGFDDTQMRMLQRLLDDEARLGDLEVTIERVPFIERTERGKFRMVVSRLPEDVRQRALFRRCAIVAGN